MYIIQIDYPSGTKYLPWKTSTHPKYILDEYMAANPVMARRAADLEIKLSLFERIV